MRTRGIVIAAFATIALATQNPTARATGTWNGQNTLHVPIAWCIVQGSPAQAAPNVAGDTITDDLIWRRHERPTDGIFINTTGITFRSAINDSWNTLDFPVIADPNTTLGTPGDMRGEDVNANGAEFNQMINDCDAAWDALGRAGVGITAVNAGAFHDGTGTYVGVIGWGGCTESTATGLCVNPHDGRIAVVDNHYLHPSVPDRRLPGTNLQFTLTDPLDQLVGHELGHSLSLEHRADATALMSPGPTDQNNDGQADNIAFANQEVTDLRAIALLVPGLEQDPPNLIIKGDVVATRKVDKVREAPKVRPFEDLASVRLSLDLKKNEVSFTQQLFGLLPEKGGSARYWFLVDADAARSAAPADLRRAGVPKTRFPGADLVIEAVVQGKELTGTVWRLVEGRLAKLPDGFRFDLQALVMYPHYASLIERDRPHRGFPVHHVVAVNVDNRFVGAGLGKPIRVQAIIVGEGARVADRLDGSEDERGIEFVLEHPSFPHCFPQDDVDPGGLLKVELEKLKPNAPIHALLGPRLIYKGETDAKGGGVITLTIPRDTTPGLHLLTVGGERTALTADCPVRVRGQKQGAQ